MSPSNTYIRYKRDQKLLVYWLIHASNAIIKSFPAETTIPLNTSGEIKISTLVSLSEVISKRISPIPTSIYRLFQSVIGARRQTHLFFKQLAAEDPDPEIEASNVSHEYWLNGLVKAFAILGGETWLSERQNAPDAADEGDEDEIFSNKFAGLNLDGEYDEDEEEETSETPVKMPPRVQKKGTKKGKGKKGKKAKGKGKRATEGAEPADIPLESYCIIEDQTGLVTDYLLAAHSLMMEWSDLRSCMQEAWRRVAYLGLHSAIAGSFGHIAVAMLSKSQVEIMADFPGHDSFETIMRTITRGNPDKAQGMLRMVAPDKSSSDNSAGTVLGEEVDVREHMMIHAYEDLVDFIADFQKTRSGKPTKSMLKTLHWDPTLDLSQASSDVRLKWRRAYTINWLYDLVNVFSSEAVESRNLKGEPADLASVDWSIHGPWARSQRMFGLGEFAGEVTKLAMQKPGTDVRSKILPHLVFQLQCIVDSFCVVRGWIGDTITSPADDFCARRDIDPFLDRSLQDDGVGYLRGSEFMWAELKMAAIRNPEPEYNVVAELGARVGGDFKDWLGETLYKDGLESIPPSRFSNSNANGLWEYSPYLCGTGLLEALEIAHGASMFMWDRVREPSLIVHLHNMLVKKGYLDQPVDLIDELTNTYRNEFFCKGKIPESRFFSALYAVMLRDAGAKDSSSHEIKVQRLKRNVNTVHDFMDERFNSVYRTKSLARLLREAYWVPDRISDDEITVPSSLALLRLRRTKRVIDPATGAKTLADTVLLRRYREAGWSDELISWLVGALDDAQPLDEPPQPNGRLSALPPGYGHKILADSKASLHLDKGNLSNEEFFFRILKTDMRNQIVLGPCPILGLSYMWITLYCFHIFSRIEQKLKELKHPYYDRIYCDPEESKNMGLTFTVMEEEDGACLRVIAECLRGNPACVGDYFYWPEVGSGSVYSEEPEDELEDKHEHEHENGD
ncbi:uncharacterized protein DSM5745_04062 [Aspergillus mulundensis]|uniref:DUF6604 domain-containing protein n=1 Tax=Aspergillus mulundensis TaxID=1810919 RepID=A0A3D8SBP2_9EURO|nr:hypothetical protein DSM5745_04062 [Aspergillus mulundensis]RDW83736.1 hypothetical protein DSM5745_04062 [Aspergillus mulundensis]